MLIFFEFISQLLELLGFLLYYINFLLLYQIIITSL